MSQRAWWLGVIGIGLALIGVWGAWVPHRAAALVLSSWDLAEFVKFVPGSTATRELFYLPAWCAGIALAVIAAQLAYTAAGSSAMRIGFMAIALALMITILPPYPHVMNGYQSAEYRWRFVLGISGALAVLSSLFIRRLPAPVVGGLLTTLALAGSVPALWQFLKVRGAIEAVYGSNLGWGWGLAVFLAGWGLVGLTGGWSLIMQSKSGPRER